MSFRAMPAAAVLAALLSGCTSGPEREFDPAGPARPTVADGAVPAYADYAAARRAFTRQDAEGVMTVTLHDAAWIRRAGGSEAEVAERHRSYLDGLTTFDVALFVKEFTRPTDEVFVLEDSTGARITTRPTRYEAPMEVESDRYPFTFELAFPHTVTSDVRWMRLTREADGTTVRWDFPQ